MTLKVAKMKNGKYKLYTIRYGQTIPYDDQEFLTATDAQNWIDKNEKRLIRETAELMKDLTKSYEQMDEYYEDCIMRGFGIK